MAYTTVQTMLNVLHRKGKVKRTLKDKAYFYRPAVSRSQVVGTRGRRFDRPNVRRLGGKSRHEPRGDERHLRPKNSPASEAAEKELR